jgi:transposase
LGGDVVDRDRTGRAQALGHGGGRRRAGRPLAETLIPVGSDELLAWAAALDPERLWAVEDCRQLTRWLERQLLGLGEGLVRVPPKLTVPERRAGRTRGKSDPIDALAIARAALREPDLSRPRPDERVYREIKLLVDHRDDVVDQRRRTQQRLRWHLHQLDPTFVVPLRMLGRSSHLERVSRWLTRRQPELQVRLARELVTACRKLNAAIAKLDQELEQRVAETAPALLQLPGCAAVTAAKLLAEIGPVERFRSDAQLARHAGVAPLEASSGRTQRHRLDRGGNRQLNAALYRIAITQSRYHPDASAYLERKKAEGKSRREAIRCLKRLLVRVIFNTLKTSPALTYEQHWRSRRSCAGRLHYWRQLFKSWAGTRFRRSELDETSRRTNRRAAALVVACCFAVVFGSGRVGGRQPRRTPSGCRRFRSTRLVTSGNGLVYLMNADGTSQRLLARTSTDNPRPVWSPDGLQIAFSDTDRG